MTIQLITFDLDHTLWDPHEALIRAEQKMYQWLCEQLPQVAILYSYDDFVRYRIETARNNPELAWQVSEIRKHVIRLVLAQAEVPEAQHAELVEEAFMVFFRERSRLEMFPGVIEVLKELSAEYSLMALTNGNASLRLAGINHWFDAYFNAENVGAPKPDGAMFKAALAQAKVTAAQAIHVGDSMSMDVIAAKQQGFKAVWANYRDEIWQDSIRPDAEIADIRQLPDIIRQLAHR